MAQSSPSSKKSRAPAKKGAASSKKTAPADEDPILTGRMITALALVLATVVIPVSPLGLLISKKSPKSEERATWTVGKEANIHVTVTTADYDKLACAAPDAIDGAHCGFKNDRERFPDAPGAPLENNKADILQPYRTTDGQLLFMNGLWAQPEIAMRLHTEPARGVAEKKLTRFVVECKVKFLQEWTDPSVRWAPRESWSKQGNAMVARPESCHILEDNRS